MLAYIEAALVTSQILKCINNLKIKKIVKVIFLKL